MNSSDSHRYIVAGSRPWNRTLFDEQLARLPGHWLFAASESELASLLDEATKPKYIFFLHWSVRVPDKWLDAYECVCFHMSDVPYGRGGSPLQNLIQRGHRETKLAALRMVHEMDAGPVYAKQSMSLEGSAEEIFLRAGRLSAEMIKEIINSDLKPVPQSGNPHIFNRRRPGQSAVPKELVDLNALHDFIRMLDAEGYPHAFIDYGNFRMEFTRSAIKSDRIVADVTITFRPSCHTPPADTP